MQDRFKYKVKFEIDGKVEIFDVTDLDIEYGQIYFKREDGQCYITGIGCEDVELIQCTGLRDVNGKLIYDKDLIKIGENTFLVNMNLLNISLTNILNGDIIIIGNDSIFNNCEVIGNEFDSNTKI